MHPPMPLAVLKGCVLVAWHWGWWAISVLFLIGFYALLRLAEMLNLCVADLLFRDIEGNIILFVRVRKTHHKGRRSKGNSWEHVRVNTSPLVLFSAACGHFAAAQLPLLFYFQGTPAAFRTRCDQIFLQVTGVPKLLLPSSFRPGGCTHFFAVWGGRRCEFGLESPARQLASLKTICAAIDGGRYRI